MTISGLQKHTLIDYPGKVAATIFLSGCNFRCPFCYNPDLVLPQKIKKNKSLKLKEVFSFLEERKGFLDGVVICGGEPTLNDDLLDFCKKIKEFGFSVKLDTNGYRPEIIEELIMRKVIDYAAMDIKAPEKRYEEVVGVKLDTKKIEQSIQLLKKEKVDYEFRTTLVPDLVEKKDILEIASWISPAKRYFLQNFSNRQGTLDESFSDKKPFSDEYLEGVREEIENLFDVCRVR